MGTVETPHPTRTPEADRSGGPRTGTDDFRPLRGPFTRWPRSSDAVLAAAVFLLSLLATATSALEDGQDLTAGSVFDRPPGVYAVLAVACVALLWRRTQPLTVAAVVVAAAIAWAVAGYGDGGDLALAVAAYGVGRYVEDRTTSAVAVALAAVFAITATIIDANQRIDVLPALFVTLLPWYVGRRVTLRGEYLSVLRERAERLESEQLARARHAVAEERSRIARELHDVVAHQVSMMTVQAGAARTVAHDDLDSAVAAMADVERAGRDTLGELRHLLGVLRPEGEDPEPLGPQPGLADVPALVDGLARTGARVTCSMPDPTPELPTAVGLSAYRIVQEALTNVVKHAGPHPTVDLSVTVEGPHLALEVTNTVATPVTPLPRSGFGTIGMRERASLLGGTLSAAPIARDRYRVTARLPLAMGTA